MFSMLCRVRWGGLEQEGFGIVFLEAAATGVPQIAGQSGGASEAVEETETGLIVHNPKDEKETARKLLELLEDHGKRDSMGKVSRERAVKKFSYDILAKEFHQSLLRGIKNSGGGSGIS